MHADMEIESLADWGMPLRESLVIAGPCSAESEEQVLQTACGLAACGGVDVLRAGIWKPRTRPGTFEGVGARGLAWLVRAREATGIPVAVEVANPEHVAHCLRHGIDVLWVGARTTVNPFSVQAIAEALRGVDIPVMVKNPINPDIELWIGAIERLHRVGVRKLAAIHRGFCSIREDMYRNTPNWAIPIELKRRIPQIPLLCDPSHICGRVDLLCGVAQRALDLHYDGLMVEVHVQPQAALSDAKQQITPEQFGQLIQQLQVRRPSSSSEEFMAQIQALRQEIDAIDGRLIELIARRMEIVERIGLCKKRNNVALFQPNRWEEMVRTRLQIAADKQLPEEFILRLFQCIHERSIQLQESVPAP